MTTTRRSLLVLLGLVAGCEQSTLMIQEKPKSGALPAQPDCFDNDGDGHSGTGTCRDDCDDQDPLAYPGAVETCNGKDDDCDGRVDEELATREYFQDQDGDGYGAASSGSACRAPGPHDVPQGNDCDDADPARHPGAVELCNQKDEDCDGQADDGLPATGYYPDTDGDGFGARNSTPVQSCGPVAGRVDNNSDCNDLDSAIRPGGVEYCNSIDDDCDGAVDDNVATLAYYPDLDADGFGAATAIAQLSCAKVAGKVADKTDCNDQDTTIHPGAAELCNGRDDDCDLVADEGLPFVSYYPDADGDGFGAANGASVLACKPPVGKVASHTDCNDANALVNPARPEVCDGVDQNCNGAIDEGLPLIAYYPDADGDTHGSATAAAVSACRQPAGRVANKTDCSDTDPLIHPGAAERCNNLDDDCDLVADEGNPGGGAICSTGQSGVCAAGNVTCQTGVLRCVRTQGPSAELCDGADNDCDGATDETFPDRGQPCTAGIGVCQASGVKSCTAAGTGTYCTATARSPTASACDGLDNDCDGVTDEPTVTGTTQIHPLRWQDTEAAPWYFSATGCAGGTTGTGSDALAGGGLSVSVQPGVPGIRYLQLGANGAPLDTTWIISSSYEYLDAAIAQAGDGFIVAGLFTPTPEIDLFYRSWPGIARARLENQLRPAAGNTLDSFRMARGNGARVVLLWRETGPVTASTGLKLAEVAPVFDTAAQVWTLRDGRTGAATLSAVTLVAGAVEAGIGADSTHWDWDATQLCQPLTTQRTLAIAYRPTAQSLRLFTVAENGTGKSAGTVVRLETGARSLAEPEVAFFRSAGADQWLVAWTTADSSTLTGELNYWMTTSPVLHSAWSQPLGGAVSRPRASVASTRIWLSALGAVADPSGFKVQAITRQLDFLGNKSPLSTQVEAPATTGSCPATEVDCRPGNKGALATWAAKGKVFYSANDSLPAGTFTSTLSCD